MDLQLDRRSVLGTLLVSLASRVRPGDGAAETAADCIVIADGGASGETLTLDVTTAEATLEGEEGADTTTWELEVDLEVELTREWQ